MAFFQTKHLWIQHLADGVATLVLDRHDSPLNILDPALLDDVDRALDALAQAPQYRMLVIRSGKQGNFCQGPSPAMLAAWKKEEFATWAERGQKLCMRLVEMPLASVAVIAGSCWDAGLELALACDYRVVVNKPSTSLGFPELEWGMIPCWGGTQRLPRLAGLENSMRMLIGGQRLDAREAWMDGLADDLAEEVDDAPPAFLERPVKRDWSSFPRRSWRESWLESNRPGRWLLFRGAERVVHRRIPEEMPAASEMLAALRGAFQQPGMQPGLDFERQALLRIVAHPALHHLLRLLQRREVLGTPAATNRLQHIGIIGAGVAGLSLLLHAVNKGCEVVLRTHDEQSLGAALAQIVQVLQAEVGRGAMTQTHYQKLLGLIRGTYTWTNFDKLDLVVDTTDGPLTSKQALYGEMETRIPADALVAAVPHAHPIEDLRSALKNDPGRLLGLRIIEPWNRGSLAEIVVPAATSPVAGQEVRDWAAALGKCCLEVPDRPGGLVMRVWLPALNEAGVLLREGVGIATVDAAMRRFGMTFGPCEWMDRLGLDEVAVLVSVCQPLFAGRISFETGFALMAEKRWLGNGAGGGFYRRGLRGLKPHAAAAELWRTRSKGDAAPPGPPLYGAELDRSIQDRLVTLTILEAVRCLDEKYVKDADDLDCALCLTGWATHRGGPIGHARQLGFDAISTRCADLASRHGPRFAAPAALRDHLPYFIWGV